MVMILQFKEEMIFLPRSAQRAQSECNMELMLL